MKLDRHREIVEQDRHDRNALAHRGLEIHAGEADRGIAPDVDAELVRAGELGAHGKAEAVAQLGGLAPADIGVRRRRLPERRELVARAAGIVGDDGVGLVDRVLQVPQHAVGVERRLVVGELGHPLLEPLVGHRLDLGHDRCSITLLSANQLAALVDHGAERQLGIADQTVLGAHILVEMVGVQRRVDHRLALGHRDAEVRLGERAADAEQHVAIVEEVAHLLRIGATARAQRQRMGLVEAALALQRRADGNRQKLGQLLQLVIGFSPMYAMTGIDDRALGCDQHLGGFLHRRGIGAVFGRDDRLVGQRIGRVLDIGLGRELDDHRRAAAVAQQAEGPAHDVLDLLARGDRLGVLGDMRHGQRRIEVGRHVRDAPGIARRDDQQRH